MAGYGAGAAVDDESRGNCGGGGGGHCELLFKVGDREKGGMAKGEGGSLLTEFWDIYYEGWDGGRLCG